MTDPTPPVVTQTNEDDPKKPYKAIVAALVAGLAALGSALTDQNITAEEWVAVALAVVVAGGAVYGVRNPTTTQS